ncbi:MAG: hypothetical protein OXN81_11795 [Alphaproteobacteria bacterium]|nr:hypothetical protein [Alphaproteobacteria bacterium]
MTDLAKLRKGAPPPAEAAPDVLDDPRGEAEETKPLQFRLPASVVREFNRLAAIEGDYSHGAKKQLFLRMWESYRRGRK